MPIQTQFPAGFFIGNAPKFLTTLLPDAQFGIGYLATVEARGTAPLQYELSDDAPEWLNIDPSSGTLSGAPDELVTSVTFTVFATNRVGRRSREFTIGVLPEQAVLNNPIAAHVFTSSDVSLEATASNASAFDFQIATAANADSVISSVSDNVDGIWNFTADNILALRYARVRAKNAAGSSDWSDWVAYYVDTISSKITTYYTLNEDGGTRADTISDEDLSDINSVASGAGKIAKAAWFNAASSQRLTHGSDAVFQTGNIHFCAWCWVYFPTLPTSEVLVMGKTSNFNSNANTEWALMFNNTSNKFRVRFSTGSASTVVQQNGSISAGSWHFVVVGHDPDADIIYIQVDNGTVVQSAHSGGIGINTTNFNVGGDSQAGHYATMYIDEIGLAKNQLNAAERTALYNGNAGKTLPFFDSPYEPPYSPPEPFVPESGMTLAEIAQRADANTVVQLPSGTYIGGCTSSTLRRIAGLESAPGATVLITPGAEGLPLISFDRSNFTVRGLHLDCQYLNGSAGIYGYNPAQYLTGIVIEDNFVENSNHDSLFRLRKIADGGLTFRNNRGQNVRGDQHQHYLYLTDAINALLEDIDFDGECSGTIVRFKSCPGLHIDGVDGRKTDSGGIGKAFYSTKPDVGDPDNTTILIENAYLEGWFREVLRLGGATNLVGINAAEIHGSAVVLRIGSDFTGSYNPADLTNLTLVPSNTPLVGFE